MHSFDAHGGGGGSGSGTSSGGGSSRHERTYERSHKHARSSGYHDHGHSADNPCQRCLCIVCLTEPRATLFLPCRHVCTCEWCAALVLQQEGPACPLCRTAISDSMILFF